MIDDHGGYSIHTTSWTLISQTREPGEVAQQATGALCRLYWKPLYVHARRAGQSAHQAEDAVQEFLAHVCSNDVFTRADASRGRFRTFLLSAFRQHIARQFRDATRQRRSPGTPIANLDFAEGEAAVGEPSSTLTPDRAFDRVWAITQIGLTWQRLEAEFAAAGKAALCTHLRPVISGLVSTPMREVADALGLSEGAANVAAHRLRKQFGEYLREQVASTLASPRDDVDDEIAYLLDAMAGEN